MLLASTQRRHNPQFHRANGWANKAWKTKTGKPKGGYAFDKGNLHALLTNSLYAGKIKHKNNVYPGEHEAIVDSAVFDEVQPAPVGRQSATLRRVASDTVKLACRPKTPRMRGSAERASRNSRFSSMPRVAPPSPFLSVTS